MEQITDQNLNLNEFIKPFRGQIFIPDIGQAVLLDVLYESLFSNSEIDFPRIELLRNGFTLRYNNQVYFITSELDRYIKFLSDNQNFKIKKITNICPINYHILNQKFSDEKNVYIKIYEKLLELRQFVFENSSDLLNLYWPMFFKGIVTGFNPNPMMMVIIFRRASGKPLVLNIINIDEKILLISKSKIDYILEMKSQERTNIDDKTYFKYVIEDWKETIILDNEKEYIINKLSDVTGSIDMANFIFESKKRKEEFIINLDNLNCIINFSSAKSKKEYIEYFCLNYPKLFVKGDKLKQQNGSDLIYINFEGFNKYLLNLNPTHLKSFNDKEQINEMYFNITNSLVECYEKLYNYQKI